jgi:hypothetical protein
MAAPTSLSVSLDLDEYSKFEVAEGRSVISATITASGGGDMSGEQATIALYKGRRNRDQTVYSGTHTFLGTSDPVSETFTIDLNTDPVDSDYINLVRRGRYFVRATSVSDSLVTADSSDVPISIITAQQLRKTWLFGLNLEASEVRDIKMSPKVVTGVEIEELSSTHLTGFSVLSYVYDGTQTPPLRQLSWGSGGPLVTITQPGQYLLRLGCSDEYAIVRVRSLNSLPTSTVSEELFVIKSAISDDLLRRLIDQAADWWENDKLAGVYLEPTRLVTDPDQPAGDLPDWDFIVPPITFYPVVPARWIDIVFPYPSLLKIDEIFGQIANTRIVDIDESWIEISERNGFCQLVPFNQSIAFQYIGLVWVESLRGKIELPNFWHFDLVAGLRQVDPVILEVLGKKAAIDALTIAGQAFRGGFASQSISRDGVSESVSYTASAIYGIYSASIEDYRKHINKEIKQLRGRYRGVNMVVMG